jgi:hypothetical protein
VNFSLELPAEVGVLVTWEKIANAWDQQALNLELSVM